MNKFTWYVIEAIDKATGKSFSWAERVHNSSNLIGYFERVQREMIVLSVNACDSKKEAERTADCWNDCARDKGNYLFA